MSPKTTILTLTGLLFVSLSTATASAPLYRPVPAIVPPATLPRRPSVPPGITGWRPNPIVPPIGSDPRTWSLYPLLPNYQPWPPTSANGWLSYYYYPGYYPYLGLPGIPPNPYLPGSGR